MTAGICTEANMWVPERSAMINDGWIFVVVVDDDVCMLYQKFIS